MPVTITKTIESQVRSYSRNFPVVFSSARGAEQWTESGDRYLDFFSGAGALNYGHNHPILKDSLLRYLKEDNVLHSLDMMTVAKRAFIKAFEDRILIPRSMHHKMMFPGPTGTNSVEAALKIARKYTGRRQIASFTNAFHGMTLGSLAVTGNATKRAGAGIPLEYSQTLPYDGYFSDEYLGFEWLDRVWKDPGSGLEKPAAIIVETVQGEGGLRAASGAWLRDLAALCRKYNIVFIVDDIQAGCGRTGTFFSFDEFGIMPDIICLSKSISAIGLPMALTLIRPDIDAVWLPGEHNGTFRGNNLAFVAAATALDTFWSDSEFQRSINERIQQLTRSLKTIASSVDGATYRGRGMLAGLAFEDTEVATKVARTAFDLGLLVETSGASNQVLKIMPPLTITEELLAEGIAIIEKAVNHNASNTKSQVSTHFLESQ